MSSCHLCPKWPPYGHLTMIPNSWAKPSRPVSCNLKSWIFRLFWRQKIENRRGWVEYQNQSREKFRLKSWSTVATSRGQVQQWPLYRASGRTNTQITLAPAWLKTSTKERIEAIKEKRKRTTSTPGCLPRSKEPSLTQPPNPFEMK